MKRSKALFLINKEYNRAQTKFPPYNSPHEGYAVIQEELDEMWNDVKGNCHQAAIEEATQVAATAIRYLVDLG